MRNVVCFIYLLFPSLCIAQIPFEETAPSKYRVVFTDKQNSPYSTDAPELFLSARAIERREKQHIPVVFNDLPVTPSYIDSIRETGAKILTVSRWFNAATIEVSDTSILRKIEAFSFVVKTSETIRSLQQNKTAASNSPNTHSVQTPSEFKYGPSWLQTAIHNGQLLHDDGYTGKNIAIAVIDAGFAYADLLPAFNHLFENGQIAGTRAFVQPGDNVYLGSTHGMSVLSIIGGIQDDELIGTAPDASFWLLRSEDAGSEYVIEEDNWIAAAEFADSVGADIINSSLGYSEFNDSLQNHSYEDMNGNTARVSIGADIAVSKGMLVVVSAGNQGNVKWKYITAPADADSVLTIGAIDPSLQVAVFSSRGPSSDNQVKPDVMALGQEIYVEGVDGNVRQGNGTSYSSPVITGLAACLWQANPGTEVMDMYSAICESSDRYYNPDYDYGYGVPDFNLANILLKAANSQGSGDPITAFPNPFYNQLYLFFKNPVSAPVNITLFDLAGKEIFSKTYPAVNERKYLIIDSDFSSLQKGIYIMRIDAAGVTGNTKLIKY